MTRKGYTIIELFVVGCILIVGCILGLTGCGSKSEGTNVGNLSSFRVSGNFTKSGEGVLTFDGFKANGNNNVVTNTWEFSCIDEKLYPMLEAAVGHRVRIKYESVNFNGGCDANTKYRITKVEVLD